MTTQPQTTPRTASFDDLRVGMAVAWVDLDEPLDVCGGTITEISHGRVILGEGEHDLPGRDDQWFILRDAPAPPVQVRREDFDALVDALGPVEDAERRRTHSTTVLHPRLFGAARALIDNAVRDDS